jgi:hypothetical protein
MIIIRQSDCEIRALVKNGDGKEYGVTLTESLSTCSCKDALSRGGIYKHDVKQLIAEKRQTGLSWERVRNIIAPTRNA